MSNKVFFILFLCAFSGIFLLGGPSYCPSEFSYCASAFSSQAPFIAPQDTLPSNKEGTIELRPRRGLHRGLYFSPPAVLQHFALGWRDFLADLFWLRFLQSADFCSFEKGLPVYTGDKKTCKQGWSYSMVSLLSDLAPRFRSPYTFSVVILSVFMGDKEGAKNILQKGLKYFPNDWKINFYAVYFYAIEMKEPEKAVLYARRSAENGGPSWLYDFSPENQPLTEHLKKNILDQYVK